MMLSMMASRRVAQQMLKQNARLIHTIAMPPSKAFQGEQPVLVYDSPEYKRKISSIISNCPQN